MSVSPCYIFVLCVAKHSRGIVHRAFLSGSYDKHVRVFNHQQELLYDIEGHSAPISAVTWVAPDISGKQLIASASYDTTARLIELPEGGSPTTLATLHLHTSPIASITANASGTHLLTAGWDSLVGLWGIDIPSLDEVPLEFALEPTRKRRRILSEGAPPRKAPTTVLQSHTARVSKALFSANDDGKAYSAGWDCTMRSWDLEVGLCTNITVSHDIPWPTALKSNAYPRYLQNE